jgi:NAD-dependent SIR2 family protein deacetylase
MGIANDIHKPEVVFFGESIASSVKERSFSDIDGAARLLVVGTTLATYSAFRSVLVQQEEPSTDVKKRQTCKACH